MSYPRYERTEFGSLIYRLNSEDTINPTRVTETLGLVYEVSGDNLGSVHKHGEAELVRPAAAKLRTAFAACGIDTSGIRLIEIPVTQVTDEVLEQVNRLISISSYGARFDAWIQSRVLPSSQAPALLVSA